MSLYLITYDLTRPGQNYPQLFERIKECGTEWHGMQNVWFVESASSAAQIRGHIATAVDSGRTLGTISTIGFIVGGVGAAVGVYGLVWGKPKSSASVAVSVGPMGGGLRGTF